MQTSPPKSRQSIKQLKRSNAECEKRASIHKPEASVKDENSNAELVTLPLLDGT